jgi:RNA polymerase sigma factor (sigma-70 family)
MAGQELNLVLQHVRRLAGASGADGSDAALLEQFSVRNEQAAFAALLDRHGPLVWGVCRRVLGDAHDAEDAFQATFLVLARRAASIRQNSSLSGWLYGVASRVSLEARTRLARRRRHERQAAERPREGSPAEDSWPELRPLLDEELSRLPEKYRAPLVLHYLEGKTKQEAARQLGWTEGTVSGRLDRARKLLRGRLVRRGVALGVTALGALLARHAAGAVVPASLHEATGRAALGGAAAPQVAALAGRVVRGLVLTRLKVSAGLGVLLAALAAGTGLAARSMCAAPPRENALALARPGDPPKRLPAVAPADEKVNPPPPDDPDRPEVLPRDRAADRLEAVSPTDWETSWKEDLDATGQPSGEVLRRLLRPWGLTVEAEPALARALAQPLHLSLRGLPRLELIEEVCRRAGVYPVYPDGTTQENSWDRAVRLKGGPRPLPIAFAGPFLVEVKEVKEFAPSATGELKVRFLAVGLPPAVALPLHDGEPIRFRRVAGPRGEDLTDAARLPSWGGSETYEGFDTSKDVYLKNLVRGVAVLGKVEGVLSVPIVTRVDTLRFTDLKPGEVRRAGGVQITLQGIKPERRHINGEQVEWQDYDFRYRNTRLFRVVYSGHDSAGRLLHCDRSNGGGSNEEGYQLVAYSQKPAAITARVMAEVKHIDYPFRLENVPLPSPEKMPEKLGVLSFTGHTAPVTVEVVNLLPEQHPPAVELRLTNHSNKDVRRLDLGLSYEEAGEWRLRDRPAVWPTGAEAKPDVPAVLARGQAKVFRVSAFGLRQGTRAARAAVVKVEFTDATEWKAPSAGEGKRPDR